ncbi:hypothetical protein DVH24_030755 [Malus domestica]|uniref:Uncharacterized protein n=1 Tax=Malus domestica TaxID=3750 RepID=A0A498HEY0_MALDO|nr:hypothetical protein DVH24_030755 [Malus domestica]
MTQWSFLYVYIRNTSSRTILDPSSLQLDLVLNEKAHPGINFRPLFLAARQRKDIVFGAKKRGLQSYNKGDGHGIGREGKGAGGFWTSSFLNLCASLGFFMAALRKSKKKEEPVLEDLPKEYYDDLTMTLGKLIEFAFNVTFHAVTY